MAKRTDVLARPSDITPEPPKSNKSKNTTTKRRSRKIKHIDFAALVDEVFNRRVTVSIGDQREKMTVFEGISLQLYAKANRVRRALRMLLAYQAFAAKRRGNGGVEVIFQGD